MADTVEYFATTLPNKFTNDSDFRDSIQDIFEFQIEGAGTWHILPEGGVVEGNPREDRRWPSGGQARRRPR